MATNRELADDLRIATDAITTTRAPSVSEWAVLADTVAAAIDRLNSPTPNKET